MNEQLRNKCRNVFNYECPKCKHRKKNSNDCSIHSAILVPMFERNEETMFAEQVAIKTFTHNTCKSFDPKE